MVELLAGALIGDLFSYQSTERDKFGSGAPFGGEFIIAINPETTSAAGSSEGIVATDSNTHAEQLFERVLAQEGTRLPGSRRVAVREQIAANGVTVPDSLHETITGYLNS